VDKISKVDEKRYEIYRDVYLRISNKEVQVVDEIKKVKDLKYMIREENDGYSTSKILYVTNQVGELIELYVNYGEEYANMKLSEFITKALPKAFVGESPDKFE
jgi:ABC-type transporter lipoprotein component MlaA